MKEYKKKKLHEKDEKEIKFKKKEFINKNK